MNSRRIVSPRRLIKATSWRIRKAIYKKKEEHQHKELQFSQVTYYAVGNAGDTVLSQCVRREFEKGYDNLGWNLIEVNQPVTEKTIQSINATKAVVIGGGGLFLPDTNKNNISGWQWAISEDLLSRIQVPVIVYAVGYNYFPGQNPDEFFIKNLILLCGKAQFIGLRNHGSVNAIKNLLPENLVKKIVYQPCTTTLIRKIYNEQLPSKKTTGNVAFNLAFDREQNRFDDKKDQICKSIAIAAKNLSDRGYKIYIVAHCENDKQFISYVNEQNFQFKFVNLSRAFPMQVYRFYNEMDCVIGMRGHAQMIPFGLNCEIITLGSHDKMRWFLEDIDALDWYIDLFKEKDQLTETILNKFNTIHEQNCSETKKRLLDAQEKLWEITQDNMKVINNIIDQNMA